LSLLVQLTAKTEHYIDPDHTYSS